MLDCHDLDGEWLAIVTGGFRARGMLTGWI